MFKGQNHLALAGAAVLTFMSAAMNETALAQGEAAGAGTLALEEVVVTARKRAESLEDVPISITAFSAEAIEERGIESVYDLAKLTPNLSFNQSQGRNFDRPVIRGQSYVLDRGVSFVVDGVYIAGNIQGADLDDLEAVEVLKGPQAANFGRGSIAGVISYRTRKPTKEWTGKISGSGGEDGYVEANGFISGPVFGEKLTFKLGARYYDFDGQYTGISSDGSTPRFGSEHSERVSAALRWEPTDNVDLSLRAYSSQNADGLYTWYVNPTLNCFTGPATGATRGGSFCGVQPEIPLNGAIRVDYADIARQGDPGPTSDTVLISSEGNWNLGRVTLTGVVSWNRQDEDWIFDDYLIGTSATNRTQTPGPTMTIANPGGINRLIQVREYQSQELRLASNSDGKFKWMAGLYNYDQDDLVANGAPEYNIVDAMGVPLTTNTGPVGTLKRISGTPTPGSVKNKAVFAQAIYDATDRLHLALEGRYAQDEIGAINAGATTNCPRNLSGEYKSFTPRGSVRFDFTEEVNVYFSVARGNKPGTFNTGLCGTTVNAAEYARLSLITPLEVKEERTLNYELGAKMRLLDGRMAIDVAMFFTDWTNQQVSGVQVIQPTTGSPTTVSLISNAGTTEIRGLEFNWRLKASKNWDLNLAYGHTNAKFTDNCDAVFAQLLGSPVVSTGPCPSVVPPPPAPASSTVRFESVAGLITPNSPEHTGSFGAEFHTPIGSGGWELFARTDLSYQSERFAEVYNHASTGDSSRVDARLGLKAEQWSVVLWGRNLGDDRSPTSVRRFINGNAAFPLQRAFDMSFPNGRLMGLTATFQF